MYQYRVPIIFSFENASVSYMYTYAMPIKMSHFF